MTIRFKRWRVLAERAARKIDRHEPPRLNTPKQRAQYADRLYDAQAWENLAKVAMNVSARLYLDPRLIDTAPPIPTLQQGYAMLRMKRLDGGYYDRRWSPHDFADTTPEAVRLQAWMNSTTPRVSAEEAVLRTREYEATTEGLYITPEAVIIAALDLVMGLTPPDPVRRIMEPSCGTGAILAALAVRYPEAGLTGYETNAASAAHAEAAAPRAAVYCQDFLAKTPEVVYDLVVMNPPFDRGVDVKHIEHAVGFLAPGGVLVSVCSATTGGKFSDRGWAHRPLPSRSFAPKTCVETALVGYRRPISE